MHALQTHVWRFYFDRATPAQQKMINRVMNFNPENLAPPLIIAAALVLAYELAQLLLLLGLVH